MVSSKVTVQQYEMMHSYPLNSYGRDDTEEKIHGGERGGSKVGMCCIPPERNNTDSILNAVMWRGKLDTNNFSREIQLIYRVRKRSARRSFHRHSHT